MTMILTITAKVADAFSCRLHSEAGTHAEHEGYVPDFMPGPHHGDYIMLDIENETGRIMNWKPVRPSQVHD